jgi:DNA mismatch repair protein MutS
LENQNIGRDGQGDLFAPSATPQVEVRYESHPVLDALQEVKPDELSPKAALELLYQLKKLTADR